MDVFAAFTEQMKKVESENPAQFESFKAGLNGVLDGKEVEGYQVGDLICSWEYDSVKLGLEDLEEEEKAKIMSWLQSNNYFVFEN